MFISFEGIDSTGKTTQIQLLSQWLQKLGIKVFITREPGGTDIGRDIRHLLLYDRSDKGEQITPEAELLLYAADRAQHVKQIRDYLSKGYTVLCDRYIDSTVAYQGYGRGLSLDIIDNLNRIATGGLMPDMTFILDLDIQTATSRRKGGSDRIESEAVAFHERVRRGYLKIHADSVKLKRTIIALDASKSIDFVHMKITGLLESMYLSRKALTEKG